MSGKNNRTGCPWLWPYKRNMHLSALDPASPQVTQLVWLWTVCMRVCGFVLAFVTIPILYIIIRFRRRGDDEPAHADVIRDFRIPHLTREIGAIPGRRNFVWIGADSAGDYMGASTEYCGVQHTWMRFRVVSQDVSAYASVRTAGTHNASRSDDRQGLSAARLVPALVLRRSYTTASRNGSVGDRRRAVPGGCLPADSASDLQSRTARTLAPAVGGCERRSHGGECAPWSPDFNAQQFNSGVVHAESGGIVQGAELFHAKGSEYCHAIAGSGGHRGPDLTSVADRLTEQQITLRILNGAYNMPSFASSLEPQELAAIVAFLNSRNPAAQANNSGK
jgi:mono/diheme cytochrome c family protein